MIKSFSKETCTHLKFYVYRLIDPRNGLTFYVGKGKGNRVFAHANCALKNFEGEQYLEKSEEDDDLKIQIIKDINDMGLQVIHVIHRFGLDESSAYEVEGALIDAYSSLTNKANGHHNNDNGVCNADELETRIAKTEFLDDPANPKYIIIKTSKWRLDGFEGLHSERLYQATKHCWRISLNKARKYPYVLSVIDGVVAEVYKVDRWLLVNDGRGRYEFEGTLAEDSVRKLFIDHRIPAKYRKKGLASPVLYSQG